MLDESTRQIVATTKTLTTKNDLSSIIQELILAMRSTLDERPTTAPMMIEQLHDGAVSCRLHARAIGISELR